MLVHAQKYKLIASLSVHFLGELFVWVSLDYFVCYPSYSCNSMALNGQFTVIVSDRALFLKKNAPIYEPKIKTGGECVCYP